MKTKISKEFTVEQPIDEVWAFLSDPEKVVTCVQGAEITEKIDEKNYKGKVSMKFGPVSAKYNGKISIEKMDDDNYHMELSGKGDDDKGKGGASMNMSGKLSESDNKTNVAYDMEVSVAGTLAQFGSRLIKEVANHLTNQFIKNFKAKLSDQ